MLRSELRKLLRFEKGLFIPVIQIDNRVRVHYPWRLCTPLDNNRLTAIALTIYDLHFLIIII